jgi:hypothetical protein
MISNILYDNQVFLHNAFFTPNEIVLIINEIDAAKVYELLRVKSIDNNKILKEEKYVYRSFFRKR